MNSEKTMPNFEYMTTEELKKVWTTLNEIFQRHHLNKNELNEFNEKLNNQKLKIPLIGAFSSGKTSLLNTLIGDEWLPTDISPETAYPTEVSYGDETKILALDAHSGVLLEISVDEFRKGSWLERLINLKNTNAAKTKDQVDQQTPEQASETSAPSPSKPPIGTEEEKKSVEPIIKLQVRSERLQRIPNLNIVDLPGVGSGIKEHDRVIGKNLKNAECYLLAVSADSGTVPISIALLVKELAVSGISIGVVITKTDKKPNADIASISNHIDELFHNEINTSPIFIATTTARKDDVETLMAELANLSELIINKRNARLTEYLANVVIDVYNSIEKERNLCKLKLEEYKEYETAEIARIENWLTIVKEGVKKLNSALLSEEAISQSTHIVSQTICENIYKNRIITLILKGGKDAKQEIQYIFESGIRAGLINANNILFSAEVTKTLDDLRIELESDSLISNIDITNSLNLVHDIEDQKFTTWRSALTVGIVGVLGAVLFPVLGLAVAAISLVTGIFLKKSETDREQKQLDKANEQFQNTIKNFKKVFPDSLRTGLAEKIAELDQDLTQRVESARTEKLNQLSELRSDIALNKAQERGRELTLHLSKISTVINNVCNDHLPTSISLGDIRIERLNLDSDNLTQIKQRGGSACFRSVAFWRLFARFQNFTRLQLCCGVVAYKLLFPGIVTFVLTMAESRTRVSFQFKTRLDSSSPDEAVALSLTSDVAKFFLSTCAARIHAIFKTSKVVHQGLAVFNVSADFLACPPESRDSFFSTVDLTSLLSFDLDSVVENLGGFEKYKGSTLFGTKACFDFIRNEVQVESARFLSAIGALHSFLYYFVSAAAGQHAKLSRLSELYKQIISSRQQLELRHSTFASKAELSIQSTTSFFNRKSTISARVSDVTEVLTSSSRDFARELKIFDSFFAVCISRSEFNILFDDSTSCALVG